MAKFKMRVFRNKKCSVATTIFILLISCSIFSLVNITPILSDETNEIDDTRDILRSSASSPLFDGMYLHHNLTDVGFGIYPSNVSYSHISGNLYDVVWSLGTWFDYWQVDSNTREISGSISTYFADFTHTPFWIFTNVSLGDNVLISSIWDGDHTFEVTDELIYDLPGYGPVGIWVLQDLADPTAVVWYEKSTGILLNGTFYYGGGNNYLIFDFISTNNVFNTISGLVAIFRNNFPWDMNVTEPILNMYGIDYTVYSSSDMGIVDLSPFEKVIIESDQDQTFYNTLGSYISWFESYAANGGILEIHACDNGWYGGSWYGSYLMPGGFNQTNIFTNDIVINLTLHPILLNPHIITDIELDGWDASAHGSFNTFPGSSKVILLDGFTLNPVFIELDFGEGTILASMQTLEFGYGNGYSNFLENVILFDPDSISVTTPDSSSSWETGTSQSIMWTSTVTIADVKIELYKDGMFEMEIISSTTNDGEYYWTIPSGLDDSTQYQIKITDVSKLTTYDFSEYFEIYNPIITVISPDSSSSWETDNSQSITWTSTGTIANVKIELYNNDLLIMEITPSTPNDGEYNWTVPSELEDSDQYQIKIIDVSNPSTNDFSDYFEIKTPPSGTVAISGYSIFVFIPLIVIISLVMLRRRKKKYL